MKRRLVRVVSGTVAGASVLLGGSVIYHAATNDGGWDGLDFLCKISIILWLLFLPIIITMWARCRSACTNDPFPDGCKSECDAIWGGLLLLESLLLALACQIIHLPSGPPT